MQQILVPIFVVVVLPVSIVLILSLININADNKRTKVILKALETNHNVDIDKLTEAFRKPVKTARELHNLRLLRGCIFSLIGVVLTLVGGINYSETMTFDSDAATIPMLLGGVSLAVGLSYLIVYYVTRNQVNGQDGK